MVFTRKMKNNQLPKLEQQHADKDIYINILKTLTNGYFLVASVASCLKKNVMKLRKFILVKPLCEYV